MTVRFIGLDAVEVTREDGSVLTCYRTNMTGQWHAVSVGRKWHGEDVDFEAKPADLTDEILAAIRVTEDAIRG